MLPAAGRQHDDECDPVYASDQPECLASTEPADRKVVDVRDRDAICRTVHQSHQAVAPRDLGLIEDEL